MELKLNSNLKNRITVINGIIHQDGNPLKNKTDPIYCTCTNCGKTYILSYKSRNKRINRNKKYNRPYPDFNTCSVCSMLENLPDSMVKIYGEEHALQIKKFQDKAIATTQKRYGVDYAMQNPEVAELLKNNNLEKYGVTSTAKLDWVQDKLVETNLRRYGYKYTCQDPEIRAKQIETLLRNHNASWVYQIRFPNGTRLEQDFEKLLKIHIDLEKYNLTLIKEFKYNNHSFDYVILNPDNTINSLIDCDGLFYHGYKTNYENTYREEYKKLGFSKMESKDTKRMSAIGNNKFFIIREDETNRKTGYTINMVDFFNLLKNISETYNQWLFNEMERLFCFSIFEKCQNSFQIYSNYINNMRLNYQGFSTFDLLDPSIKQDNYYFYPNTIGVTPYDFKENEDYIGITPFDLNDTQDFYLKQNDLGKTPYSFPIKI